jgi:serine/threonine-protein kinase
MLTGKLPFKGATSTALALQIVQAAPPVPSAENSSVPRELDPIVAKALAKSLDQRYESAATMAAELRAVAAILDVRSHRLEPPSSTVTILPPRRSYGRAIAVAVLLAAAAAAAWVEREPLRVQWRRMFGQPPAPVIAVIPWSSRAPIVRRPISPTGSQRI